MDLAFCGLEVCEAQNVQCVKCISWDIHIKMNMKKNKQKRRPTDKQKPTKKQI